MKPTIEIIPEDLDAKAINLICEVSESAFTFILQDDQDKIIKGISSYAFEAELTTGDIPAILKDIFSSSAALNNSFNKVFISYSYPESVLMPASAQNQDVNHDIISLVHGDQPGSSVFSDLLAEKNIHNQYRISTDLHQFIIKHYPLTAFAHQYSLMIKQLPEENNVLKVIFYRDKIVVMLSINGMLQLIQTFTYASPQDIIYNLLNVCKQFEVEDPLLSISGMIDPESGLYKEIKKYFRNLELEGHDEKVQLNGADFPKHYFAHLFSIAQCV